MKAREKVLVLLLCVHFSYAPPYTTEMYNQTLESTPSSSASLTTSGNKEEQSDGELNNRIIIAVISGVPAAVVSALVSAVIGVVIKKFCCKKNRYKTEGNL